MNYKYLICYISFFIPFFALADANDYKSIEFVKNHGQWDGPFVYKSTFGNIDIFLENNAITYLIADQGNNSKVHDYKLGILKTYPKLPCHAYRVKFLNSNTTPEIYGSKAQERYYNYYLGNDKSKWKSNIHPELAVDYKQLYPGVDMHIASSMGNMKYDLIVKPNASVEQIELAFDGVDDLKLEKGDLIVKTSVGDIHEMAPYAYQYINGERVEVPCRYKLRGNTVSYVFPKGYDKSVNLVIDPTIVFATFTGSTADNWGFTATYDPQGNFYAGGVASGNGYPRTLGSGYAGGGSGGGNGTDQLECDIVITKFAAAGGGNSIIFSTYIGGADNEQPHSMVVAASGELFIAGRTYSSDYPNTTTRNYNGGADIIITKLSTTGAVTSSTLLGGSADDGVNISSLYGTTNSLKHSYADDSRSEVLTDNNNNVYVASCTRSTDFDDTLHSIKTSTSGNQDGVVLKLNNNLSTLLWGTYLGGSGDDAAYVLDFNNDQSAVYVSGGTASANFPAATGGFSGLWPTAQGDIDGYIVKFRNGGNYDVLRGTMIGRGSYDQCFGIQVDNEDNVYVNGNTLGNSFPVTPGVFSNQGATQFIMKLDSTLSNNIYSTVYGSLNATATNITPTAFLVDTCQNVYISGWGGATAGNGGNTRNMYVDITTNPPTPSAVMKGTTNGSDFYFIVFSKDAKSVLFAGYYGGGNTNEHVDGGTSRFDENGVIYQAICGGCGGNSSLPTTNAHSTTNGSTNCNFLALKIAFNLGSVSANATVSPDGLICLGESVTFSSQGSSNATQYFWDFGDGNTSTAASPTHTYAAGGTYQVKLRAENPNACNTKDSASLTVIVDTNRIAARFDVVQTDTCDPYVATFTNTSQVNNPNNGTYLWEFGDGTSFTGSNPPAHTYASKGTYTVKLTMTDPGACNSPDSTSTTITFDNSFVEADFEGPESTCEKTKITFNNQSANAQSFLWEFGDGSTSTESNPEHSYDTAGVYSIKLYSYNDNTCNQVDSIIKSITINPTPIAAFRHTPVIPVTNEPINFTNNSEGANSYVWDMGDGTSTEKEIPDPKFYKKTGRYLVCLQAINSFGCVDTVCRYVEADVYPLADLPTGFTPNDDGKNDILYVRGAAIESIDLKIYNRWGETVFQTTDINTGWDGKYKNKPQPTEAYGYVLNVIFVDGTTLYKKGNVTLMR